MTMDYQTREWAPVAGRAGRRIVNLYGRRAVGLRTRWPGYAVFGGVTWKDPDRMAATHPRYAGASTITDESDGEKLWLVRDWNTRTVSYKPGSERTEPEPDHQDWYYVPDYTCPIVDSNI